MEASRWRKSSLEELGEEECRRLAATQPVGRIAWAGPSGISVIPVNHHVDGRDVVLRTSPYSALARECVDHEVAFQVDVVDEDHHAGWSVLFRGRCRREERAGDEPVPWATGPRMLGLRIEVHTVTGRRVAQAGD